MEGVILMGGYFHGATYFWQIVKRGTYFAIFGDMKGPKNANGGNILSTAHKIKDEIQIIMNSPNSGGNVKRPLSMFCKIRLSWKTYQSRLV